MRTRMLAKGVAAAALLLAPLGAWATEKPAPGTDADIAKRVTHEIRMYPYYSLWDDINVQVNDGSVELVGAVNQPWKKSDIGNIIQKVHGVTSLTNDLKVLPLSPMDDRIRLQVARAIYRDPVLSRYGMGVLPAIHIIVENGHVTLDGVVENNMDKEIAGVRASSAGLSFGPVVNNLQVEQTSSHKS